MNVLNTRSPGLGRDQAGARLSQPQRWGDIEGAAAEKGALRAAE